MTETEAASSRSESGLNRVWRFGDILLDQKEQRLMVGGQRQALSPRAFDLLVLLVERNGRLIRRQELMELLWPGGFVEDATLARYVSDVRKALGADAGCIETVPKSGYRFSAAVVEVPGAGDEDEPSMPGADQERNRRFLFMAGAGTFLAILALAASLPFIRWILPPSRPLAESVAVIPFTTIGASENNEHLELGLADVLISRLSRVPDLEVRSLAAVSRYQGAAVDSVAVGRELGVEAVLEGTLRRSDGRLRVSARLVSVSDGRSLWSGSFDHADVDLLGVEDAIGRETMLVLAPSLQRRRSAEGTVSRPPVDAEAHDLYLRGRYFFGKRTSIDHRRAIEFFDAALARDPDYAEAEAGLAATYGLLAGLAEPPEMYELARRHAERASSLDPLLADAHTVLGLVAMNYDGDWAAAEGEYRKALEIQPNHPTTHHWLGEMLVLLGRPDEGLSLLARAEELDPLSLAIVTDIAKANYFARRWETAIARGEEVLTMDSQYAWAWVWVGASELELGNVDRALECLTRFEDLEPLPFASAVRMWALVAAGHDEEADRLLRSLEDAAQGGYVMPVALAMGRLAKGDDEGAMDALEELIETRQNRVGISTTPLFDSLRSKPRYLELMRRANLAPAPL